VETIETRPGSAVPRVPVAISVIALLGALALGFFAVGALIDPAGLLPAGSEPAAGLRTYAHLMAVRNVAIVLVVAFVVVRREARVLAFLLALLGIVQAFDAVLGAADGQLLQTVVPGILSIVFFSAAYYLTRHRP